MASMMEWALRYARRGMYVLPMIEKRPLVQFADKPPLTEDEIREIWTMYPEANIALRTVDFFVIDIDIHDDGANGFETIKNWDKKDLLADTLTQKTAGGGLQLFYLKRKDIEVRQNIDWMPGVDVKAHINNYVMVPPSVHNGKEYEWVDKAKMVTASKELVKATIRPDTDTGGATGLLAKYKQVKGGQNRTTNLFETIANGLGGTGGRNNALTELVGGLLFRDVGIDETLKLAEIANANTPDPLTDREFKRTVESMIKKEIRRRANATPRNN